MAIERQPGETLSECVSRKIPILISEGMQSDQAVAVANEICTLKSEIKKLKDKIEKQGHGRVIEKQISPDRGLDREEGKKRLEARSRQFEIEITNDAKLSFPGDNPTDLKLYADPVNLKFPMNDLGHANNARARFKQVANTTYKKPKSRNIVHERIVRRQLELGATPSINMDDPLDRTLPKSLRDRAQKEVKKVNCVWGGLFK